MKLDRVETEIRNVLRNLGSRSASVADTDFVWTREVKNAVGQLGRKSGFAVYASTCDESTDGEWMFDLTWMEYDARAYMTRLPLVLESEWTPTDVADDFCKLIVARAEHRVMVFWANDEGSARRMVEELVAEVENGEIGENRDRYLFVVWLEHEDRFWFWLFVVGQGMTGV